MSMTIGAESPVPVVLDAYSTGALYVYPLTPCCHASGKGWMDDDGFGVVCRNCMKWVDDLFGMCWPPEDKAGWKWYFELLLGAGEDTGKAAEITQHVHDKVLAAAGDPHGFRHHT